MITILRKQRLVARVEHDCIWCPEKIVFDEKYLRVISVFDGDFQNHCWHPECYEAMQKDFTEHHEEEFSAHAFKRGTNEEVIYHDNTQL